LNVEDEEAISYLAGSFAGWNLKPEEREANVVVLKIQEAPVIRIH
jgi:hypothetical protein